MLLGIPSFDSYAAASPSLVKDIAPGTDSSLIFFPQAVEVGNFVFFAASDGTVGRELWKSDGTPAGTTLVKDIHPGPLDSDPQWLTNVNGTLFFVANDGVHGFELWRSDGTAAGTTLVKDIYVVPDDYDFAKVMSLTNVNGTLFFTADNGSAGIELWKSDGTNAGTVLVKDINPGGQGSTPAWLTDVNGMLFFFARTNATGMELWKSDGTAAGTILVKDINPGSNDSLSFATPLMTNVNGTLFFGVDDGTHGVELWRSNGTAAGTALIKDIHPGPDSAFTTSYALALRDRERYRFAQIANTIYFVAADGSHGQELWKSDGTATGTQITKDINPGTANGVASEPPVVMNDTLFFIGDDGVHGFELWRSDGTTAGTALVSDIVAGGDSSFVSWLTPVSRTGKVFFAAENGATGRELWESDGTSAGTRLISDIAAGRDSSNPVPLRVTPTRLFFAATKQEYGRELWMLPFSTSTTYRQLLPLVQR